jgi:hypothetical protein
VVVWKFDMFCSASLNGFLVEEKNKSEVHVNATSLSGIYLAYL